MEFLLICFFCKKKKTNTIISVERPARVTAIYIARFFFLLKEKVSGWGGLPGVCGAADQCGAVNVITALWRSDNQPVCLSTLGKCTGILNVAEQTWLWAGNSVCVGHIIG